MTSEHGDIFEITDTVKRVDIDKQGRFIRKFEGLFTTAKGVEDSIFIAETGFTAEKAKELVRARAVELDATVGAKE